MVDKIKSCRPNGHRSPIKIKKNPKKSNNPYPGVYTNFKGQSLYNYSFHISKCIYSEYSIHSTVLIKKRILYSYHTLCNPTQVLNI